MVAQITFVLRIAAFVALGVLACGPVCAQQHSVSYQINPAHTGAVEFARTSDVPLQKVWSLNLRHQISYPVVAGGKLFVTVGGQHSKTTLVAIALQTGETLWSISIPSFISWSTLTYDSRRLFVINSDGLLQALNPDDGSLLWSRQLAGNASNALPTARDGIVYVSGGSVGGTLYAIRERDGEVIWTQSVENGDVSAPALSTDGVFVSYLCQVYQFENAIGATRWHVINGCEGGGGSTAVLYSDRVYARDFDLNHLNNVHILDARTGTDIGTIPNVTMTPAFRGDIGYFVAGTRVLAQAVSTQTELWRFTASQQLALPPIVVNGKVIVCSTTGHVYVLDGTTGKVLQDLALGTTLPVVDERSGEVLPGLGVGGGMVIVPAGTHLIALRGTR